VIGRFISPDPLVQAPFDPQSLNRYSYVRNNPLIYVDPSGYSWFSKAWKRVKKAAKKAAKAVVSVVTSNVLTHAIFSVIDIGVPGLGQAISFGIGILSARFGDYTVDKLWGGNKGGCGGPPMSGVAGGRSFSGSLGDGYTGPLFPSGVSPGGGYTAISGTTYDFVHGYSANVVTNGHVFYGAFYQAIGRIYSGVKKGLVAGAKGAKTAIYAAGHELTYNKKLQTGTIWGFKTAGKISALNALFVGAKTYALFDIAMGGPVTTTATVYAGTPQGQIMIHEFFPSIFPSPPVPTFWGWIGYEVGGALPIAEW